MKEKVNIISYKKYMELLLTNAKMYVIIKKVKKPIKPSF